ncbi:hypothetical protein [Lactobacillus sp.]
MKTVNAVAQASHAKPSDVLKQLQDDDYQLEIDVDMILKRFKEHILKI